MADVELKSVSKRFGNTEVIPDLSLKVPSESFSVLVGPSGCGKSTLLRMIAGLEETSGGQIFIDGEDVTHRDPSDRGIAMVFQSYALYPHMSVGDNIAFALKLAGKPKDEIRRRVNGAAQILQLETLLDRKPKALSGGQRQRVAIGRAIVRQPKVFLFDEPLSNLDAALRGQMRVELAELHSRLQATMIYVTHDQVEAMTMASQIVVLRAGVIQQVGKPLELYTKPANTFVGGFIGSPKMNFFSGDFARKFGVDTVGIRPEHLSLASDDPLFTGTVAHAENLGADTLAYIDSTENGRIVARLDGATILSAGDQIGLAARDGAVVLFDKAGQRVEGGKQHA
ncbi:ABC transporter ATP-binding protein [Martelella sp. HB161492]|uniref:ABC transporter ATP-binding protein n=1 Tax=Martelella sp. HB161492 TaxID=2720726 RepID=UPI0015929457|nr:ABC transporter ATP-binding protein [Martelella sp. HB161492]